MTFIGLVWHNVSARRMRAALTAGAVAIGVMAVVALGTLTSSLEQSATGFLKAGNADFTIAQKHTDSLLNSLISSDDIASIAKVDGVEDSIGALIELDKYDAGHPTVVQVGLAPDAQSDSGSSFSKDAPTPPKAKPRSCWATHWPNRSTKRPATP
ncbi:MAG: ABC transporter permease [Candidatus Microthrix sp.]|nr:ABC transporter permease [Candidatus Microthrix sp.]MBK6438785.1 ABC transporter permease [Candidatus Microthrix sp.]